MVIRRRPDHRFEARIWVEGRRISVYGRDLAEVQRKLDDLQRQLALGQVPPPGRLTVGELIERWILTEQKRWRPRTLADYRRLCSQWVFPHLGRVRLAKLSPDRLQRFLDNIPGRAASQTYRLLHRAFAVGVRWGWLSNNPCDRVVPPGYRPKQHDLPDIHSLTRLFACCLADDEYGPLIGLTLLVGWRFGEAASLRWSDVQLNEGRITIQRSAQRIARQWVESPPKTRAGYRVVSLAEVGIMLLRRQRAIVNKRKLLAGPDWCENDLVFPNRRGHPLENSVANAALARLCARAQIQRLTFHQLRHLSASLALSAGAPIQLLASRLGHCDPSVTARIYAHALSDGQQVAVAIERILAAS